MNYMITSATSTIEAWFTGRLPGEWTTSPPQIIIDRDEITVVVHLGEVPLDGDATEAAQEEAAAGRASAWREETREARMTIAREAEHRFDRKVSWGVRIGDRTVLFTHLAVPAMTRLRQPQRQLLDTLVSAGVATSRSDALAWCVRLVEQHNEEWLAELREAMEQVRVARSHGPA
jgi:post-segregation antitoxin (ccd killing protein)